jgi:hypothetical protein
MLSGAIAIFAIAWALWFTFMCRYPGPWSRFIDRIHVRLADCGLSFEWMRRAEKGATLKVLVAVTTVASLACLAILLKHPTALEAYLHHR